MKLHYTFKEMDGCLVNDLQRIKPELLITLGYLACYCRDNNLQLKITNIMRKYKESVSDTHPEGRAIDVSTRGWKAEQINDCIGYLDEHCGEMGAISSTDGMQRIAIFHNVGLGDHIHIQVRR